MTDLLDVSSETVDRRRAIHLPVPNPGRRATDGAWGDLSLDLAQALAPSPRWLTSYARRLRTLDVAAASLAALIALGARFGADGGPSYFALTALFPLGWLILLTVNRAYELRFLGTGNDEYRQLTQAAWRYGGLIAITAYAVHTPLARGYLFVALPIAYVLGLGARRRLRNDLRRRRLTAGVYQHRVVVVGGERASAELIRQVQRHPEAGFDIVAACISHARCGDVLGVPVLGGSDEVVDVLASLGADTVAVAGSSDLSHADLRRLGWRLEGSGVTLVVAPSITDVAGPRIHIRPVAGLPLLHVEQPEFRGGRRVLKALLDRSAAAVALLLFAPLLLVVALAVRATSRGPILFRQIRVREHGRTFIMIKFRSMYDDAEKQLEALLERNERDDGFLFKMRKDPRVTPVGRFLRRYSLDELPQLLNILRGDMSLVGPRPPLEREVVRYGGDVGRRLLVKPGLTGMWQVSGRSELTWDEAVRMDLDYIENWSLSLDFVILWRTVAAVLRPHGAY